MSYPSAFIRPMHPKTEISPLPLAIRRILDAGWVGQLKIHGHRAQIHVPADGDQPVIAYNRQGKTHTKELTPAILGEIRRIFSPKTGKSVWNVIDAEWVKTEDKIYVFDFIKQEGEVFRRLTFPERWEKLPRLYLSPFFSTLPLIRDLEGCLKALHTSDPLVEGLVFKSATSPGFADTSIIRCRRSGKRP